MSSVSLQDLIKKGYNIVSVNARDVVVSEAPPKGETKEDNSLGSEAVALLDRFGNIVEPPQSKAKRAFLLASELVGKLNSAYNRSSQSSKNSVMKGKKGKRAGKANGVKAVEMGKAWGTGPPPFLGNYIPSNKPFKFTQSYFVTGILTTSGTLDTFYATYFTSANIDQFSSFAAVFDQYRFDVIEVWIMSEQNFQTNTTDYATVIDYDDVNALTTYQEALDYSNVIESQYLDGHYHRFVPHCAVASFSGAFTSYANIASPWIDCASTGVQHYGIKMAAKVNTVATSRFDMRVRITASFRNVR